MDGVPERAARSSALCALLLAAGAAAAGPVPIAATFDEVLPGGTIVEGLEAGDALGSTVVEIGDVDGDGIRDLAFIARYRGDMDDDARILLGFRGLEPRLGLDGWLPWGIRLPAEERFPCPRAGLGDLDGDGFDDLAFSAAGPLPGTAIVLFGSGSLPSTRRALSAGATRTATTGSTSPTASGRSGRSSTRTGASAARRPPMPTTMAGSTFPTPSSPSTTSSSRGSTRATRCTRSRRRRSRAAGRTRPPTRSLSRRAGPSAFSNSFGSRSRSRMLSTGTLIRLPPLNCTLTICVTTSAFTTFPAPSGVET